MVAPCCRANVYLKSPACQQSMAGALRSGGWMLSQTHMQYQGDRSYCGVAVSI